MAKDMPIRNPISGLRSRPCQSAIFVVSGLVGHYADAQAWTTNADVLEPLLLQTYPSAIERFNHIPWVIEQSDTNKVLMAAYFPMEYAILSLLAPEETWHGFPLSPAREFDDLRSMFKHVTLGHHEPLPLPLPTCEPLD